MLHFMKRMPLFCRSVFVGGLLALSAAISSPAQSSEVPACPPWIESEIVRLEQQFDGEITSAADWEKKRANYRKELKEMLGLEPAPPRNDLKATITGILEADGVIVEKLHFQAVPGLYVAANFFRPKTAAGPLPTILYLCGHGQEMGADGRSNGNKTHYQHHGAWFARHGYNCLIIDTVQWGEFLGEHWGTYRLNRWWWVCRGYTPAGVETWSGVRALDYLATRPEVDMAKIGCTGRSGGGAYTWFVTAVDDRISVACPTAGITTLRDHVVGGCIDGHCDCMFMNNFHRWDFDKVAALTAPRPLCILNTDKDEIFPLGGVMRIYNSTRRLYRLLGIEKSIGLQISEGPHQDTQPLNFGAFQWFNRFLKGGRPMDLIDEPARPLFQKDDLRVFAQLPADEIDTRIDEHFVPPFQAPPVPESREQWENLKKVWMEALRTKVFGPWMAQEAPPPNSSPPDSSPPNPALLRRLNLIGMTADALETWRLCSQLRRVAATGPADFTGDGIQAARAIYAALFCEGTTALTLARLPVTHRQGPYYFNILRHLDLPQAVAMAAEKCRITLTGRPDDWTWAVQTAERMGFAKNLTILPEMELVEARKIWDAAPHNAFTDLIRFKDAWFCVFREGSSHVPGLNGTIRVLTSTDGTAWESAALLAEPGIDLRDPKICEFPAGRLMLTMGGSVYDGTEAADARRKPTGARSRTAFSEDGRVWTAPHPVCREGDWLWRVTPAGESAFGMSYTTADSHADIKLTLWKTKDGMRFEEISSPNPGRQCWPNETTLRLLPDQTLLALVRNEKRGGSTLFGRSAPPYSNWSWTDTGHPSHGPNFLRLEDGRMIYAGRDFAAGKPNTTVGRLSLDGAATPLLVLPSGGDTSYPGMTPGPDGQVWISYYSSHEGKSAVYLAKIRLR